MKQTQKIPRPHRSGRCQKCHSFEDPKKARLCLKCSEYVEQDYGTQPCSLLPPAEFDDIAESADSIYPARTDEEILAIKAAHRLVRKSGLSRQQMKIVQLIHFERKTRSETAKLLRVTRSSVWRQLFRAQQKLGFCRPRALYMRGIHSRNPIIPILKAEPIFENNADPFHQDPKTNTANQEAEFTALPVRTYTAPMVQKCPRCCDRVFRVNQDYQYCMNCLWNSDQDTHFR